jgi:hypothetical protein
MSLLSRVETLMQRGGRVFAISSSLTNPNSCQVAWVLTDEQAKTQITRSRQEAGHRRQLPTGQKPLRTVLVTAG